tara:strand:- start:1208 stop:1405 length:198 start_codon:yes stop_codon:yes gene_type:complete
MIKTGDRVTLFSDMRRKATVLTLKKKKNQTWMVGGTADVKIEAVIRFDDGEEKSFPLSHLMPLHE